jgi:hypothetical protein
MKLRNNLALVALLALISLSAPAKVRAQSISSPYQFLETKQEAGLFLTQQDIGTGRFGFGPGPGVAMGAKYGVDIAGPLGLEGVVTYLPTTRDIIDAGRDEGDQVIGDMASDILTLDARLRFSLTGDRSWHALSPFLMAGGGFAFDVSGDESDREVLLPDDVFDFGTSFVGLLGGGIRWFPAHRFLVRGDFTLTIWQLETPLGFSDPERGFVGVDEKEWVSGTSFSLGFGIRF